MQRRQLLKTAVALPLLGALAPLAAARVMSPFQRVRPSDPYWPSAAEWQSLKSALGGNLLEVPPLFAACAGSGENAACAEVLQNQRAQRMQHGPAGGFHPHFAAPPGRRP